MVILMGYKCIIKTCGVLNPNGVGPFGGGSIPFEGMRLGLNVHCAIFLEWLFWLGTYRDTIAVHINPSINS